MVPAIIPALLLLQTPASPTALAKLEKLAQARNVAALSALLAPLPPGERNPFKVLSTGGAYDTGRFGWHAFALGTNYVVIGTRLTGEDIGQIVLRREGAKLRFIPETETYGVRPLNHDVELWLKIPSKSTDVIDRFKFVSSGSGSFFARLSDSYKVSSIRDENGRAVPFSQAAGVVLITKPKKEIATYEIRFTGKVDLPLFAGSISDKEATLVNDYWLPMIARQPSPFLVKVHAPLAWKTVGQGTRVVDVIEGNERITQFRMDLPIIFPSLSSGPYKSFSKTIDGLDFTIYSPRLTDAQMELQTELYAPVVKFYNSVFGDSPFQGYGALDSPAYGGGAMEAYSYATWGGGLPMEDSHEPAHTWWGGMINNSYLHSFWNESFAVFCEGLFAREVPIGKRDERRAAFISTPTPDPDYLKVACSESGADTGPVASALGYGKGAKVLQMLEQLIGTENIIESMRQWIATHPKGKTGEWEDFERVVSSLNPDKNLKSFFDDWIRRPGYTDFTANVTYANGKVNIDLKFVGRPFRIPLEVLLQYPDGSQQFLNLDVRQNGPIRITSPKPSLVSLDPNRRILRPFEASESPTQLARFLMSATRFTDPAHPDWGTGIAGKATTAVTTDLNRVVLVGHPDTLPAMKPLLAKAGFDVQGDKLTYDGTTIDLNFQMAAAVVDLGDGKSCAVVLGKAGHQPNFGRARLALTDNLGRFLRGKTDPKTSGKLTFRL